MVQKTLFKNKKVQKKTSVPNRHGKTPITKKGKFHRPPKRANMKMKAAEEEALTQVINARNEAKMAGIAAQKGGHLKVVKAPVVDKPDGKSRPKVK
eukprot:jgi/Botrbrau1/1169/Bobra.0162s0056.1